MHLQPSRRLSHAGFSLIEMLTVVVVIGVLAAIGASRINWLKYRADSVSRTVATELAKAQRLAVSMQTNVRVTQIGTNGLQVHVDDNQDGGINTGERVLRSYLEGTFVFDRDGAAGVPAPDDPTNLTALVLRRDGSASRGGTFYMTAPNDTACGLCRAVSISRGTGRVARYRWVGSAWQGEN